MHKKGGQTFWMWLYYQILCEPIYIWKKLRNKQLSCNVFVIILCLIRIKNRSLHTIHLSLIWENDLAAATGRVDGKCLLETLLNIGTPYTLRITVHCLIEVIAAIFQPLLRAPVRTPLVWRNGAGSDRALPRAHTLFWDCKRMRKIP